jgi:hypothetical protein
MNKVIQKILALFRLNEKAICDASVGFGPYDYHDYPDSIEGEPWHFYLLTCKRCGKKFFI